MPVFGGGNTKFQPVHVWDLAKAITQAGKDRNLRGKTIEAGGPTGMLQENDPVLGN